MWEIVVPVAGIAVPVTGLLVIGVSIIAKSSLGEALAERIRAGGSTDELQAQLAQLQSQVDQVRAELAETQERLDFAERLLTRGHASPAVEREG